MNALNPKRPAMRVALATLLLAAPTLFLPACTDLGEETFSVVQPGEFFQTEQEVIAALAPVYAQLRATLWAYHNLTQVSSDESIVPTRGSDWFDGGRWLSMHRQTWDPTLVDLNDAWVAAYTGVARANGLLQNLEAIDVPNKDGLIAELRALRAYYYYQLLDLFGNVPIVGDEEGEFLADPDSPPPTETRETVYNFIVSELQEARDTLPDEADLFGRMTKGAADAMLANLFINAAVFTNNSDAIDTDGYNSCQEAGTCQAAIDAVDRVLDSPAGYELVTDDWYGIFGPNNEANPEHIFVVQTAAVEGIGMNFQMRYLHYNQLEPSPWNGFSTIAETYNAFPDADGRKDIFLVGQQISYETGDPVEDRNGNPLIFTPDCGDIENTTEGACARIAKFLPDPDHIGGDGHGNDYPFFRVGEMYLIKAEALNELGQTGQAIDLVNDLRERVYDASADDPEYPTLDDFLLDSGLSQSEVRDWILQERLFELTYEAKRRQDLVRFGRFDDPWSYKDQSEDFRILFPIPQTQRDANPNHTQNPGY
ncbi:MAG: RagB/SusD family nutrient uptake outer membrane protein [Rhodothermales bacterium]|nr:RagB/SusD family nutrient uptake outer membrane protein [Rhodothermales bacterium]